MKWMKPGGWMSLASEWLHNHAFTAYVFDLILITRQAQMRRGTMKIQTTASNRRRLNKKFTRAAALCLLALLAVLCHSHEARAQWTTSGTNTTTTNNVGIGTSDPSQGGTVGSKFTVASSDDTSTAIATSNGTLPRFALNNHADGSWTMYDYVGNKWNTGITQKSGNFGIGTTSPASLLHVYNNQNAEVIGTVENPNAGATAAASLEVKANHGYAYLKIGSTAYGAWAAVGTTGTGSFYYDVFNAAGDHVWRTTASANERMRLTNAGNVGIGTPNPVSKLHVVGDITVTGNINAKYQDVAEWVPSTQKLSVGTVVVVDAEATNQVLASSSAYDTGVAGVITGQPGLLLGEGGEGKVKVATTGRVKVRVDATRAPVRAGDLLVTSDVPGVAMRSEPVSFAGVSMHRPGTIIGKALEPLAKGTGEILVLLSLQ
jgi:hypothetical protein